MVDPKNRNTLGEGRHSGLSGAQAWLRNTVLKKLWIKDKASTHRTFKPV